MGARGEPRATKVCRVCKRRKRLTAFWRRTACADGRDLLCGDCKAAYFRRWCAANRDHYNRESRAYYRANLERLREYNREYQRRRRALMRTGKWKARARQER
jgi:superfamily II helicase